ncbi:GNAT family N-acetyltransferase [bacterium]|nr:GNAT family N-acetyltransferase [bacterium]
MELIQLTRDNAGKYGFGCMMKGNLFVPNPKPYRDALIPDLGEHAGKDISGFVAVESDKPVGHVLLGTARALGLPMRVQPDAPVILCTAVQRAFKRKGVGRALIQKAAEAFKDAPGLVLMSTNNRMYMPLDRFRKYGFRQVGAHDAWRIGYLPIRQEQIVVDFFEPQLEWDYIRPFTLIQGGFCPFMLHVWNTQKKAAASFKRYAPVEEMTLEEARKKDANAVPGFYVFGSMAPAKPMFGWQMKRYIRRAIRREEKKTFGNAAPTAYEKRKKKTPRG